MFDFRIVSPLPLFLLLTVLSVSASATVFAEENAPNSVDPQVAQNWAADGWPLLQQFCLDCHNEDYSEGELDLTPFEHLDSMASGAASMQRVLEMVRFGAMPPEDADLPSDQQRKKLVDALDQTVFAVSCDLRPRPGKVTARRLNRAEYNNTIRDLFGMDLKPAEKFPSDDVGAGFDNNSDVLSLSTMLIEKYLDAAEEVSSSVIVDPDTLPSIDSDRPSDQWFVRGEYGVGSFNGMFIAPETVIWTEFDVPIDGDYRMTILCGSTGEDDDASIALYDQKGHLLLCESLDHYGGSGGSKRESLELELTAGKHQFFVRLADEMDEKSEIGKTVRMERIELSQEEIKEAEQQANKPLRRDRKVKANELPLMVRRLSLDGPTRIPEGLLPPSQSKLIRKAARRSGSGWSNVESAAKENLHPFIEQAFRRPVSKEEVQPYVDLVSMVTQRGESFYRGMQVAVSAALVSPQFLFRIETPADDWAKKAKPDDLELGNVSLTQHQLASRISYFLYSSMPDEPLRHDADRGKLTPERVSWHIERMLNDEKSRSLAQQFAAQWLGLRNLETHEADAEKFPGFTDSLKHAMKQETERLFSHIALENRPVRELLTSDYTFVNRELAGHYGLNVSELFGDEDDTNVFVRVSLRDLPRRGVLSHASVLTLTSNPNRTSPVRRGKWILENILGTPPPEPPSGVPELEETKTAAAGATLRQQLELHRADPSCAACHRVMDQLGFGLEQFNAVGQFRLTEDGLKIDSSGELPGGRTFLGGRDLSEMLGDTEAEAFAKTVTERMMTFALGRELSPTDRCVIDEIVHKTSGNDYRFRDLITEIINSRPFQYYEWNGPASQPLAEAN